MRTVGTCSFASLQEFARPLSQCAMMRSLSVPQGSFWAASATKQQNPGASRSSPRAPGARARAPVQWTNTVHINGPRNISQVNVKAACICQDTAGDFCIRFSLFCRSFSGSSVSNALSGGGPAAWAEPLREAVTVVQVPSLCTALCSRWRNRMRFGKKSRDEDLEVVPVIGKESEQEEPSRGASRCNRLRCPASHFQDLLERGAAVETWQDVRPKSTVLGAHRASGRSSLRFAALSLLCCPTFSGAALMLAGMFFRDSAMGRRAISLSVAVLPGSYIPGSLFV